VDVALAIRRCRRRREPQIFADDIVEHRHVGTVTLRFIYLGMIAEVACHAGHADIRAEQIQAATKSSTDTAEQRLKKSRRSPLS
jgi:hypothetical protein